MMNQNKDASFKCPACGEMLSVESKNDSNAEATKPRMNTGNMPMGQLKSKISSVTPTSNPPGTNPANLNSY